MKIDWTEFVNVDSRISINDDVITVYADKSDLPDPFSLREIAEAYAKTYDRNGNDDTFTVATIEDLYDGETHRFAFDGNGNFEWDTDRRA